MYQVKPYFLLHGLSVFFFLDDTKDIKFFHIVMKTPTEDSNSGRVKWTKEHSNIFMDICIKGTHNGYRRA